MMIMDTKNLITCPISYQIFSDPVVCTDGVIYEREVIETWLKNHTTSPWTKEQLVSNILIPLKPLKQYIETYLVLNPKDQEDRFVPKLKQIENKIIADINSIGSFNQNEIEIFLKQLTLVLDNDILTRIFTNYSIVKYILETLPYLNIYNTNNSHLIHFICYYSSAKIIQLIYDDKYDFNLNVEDDNGWTPIQFICYRGLTKIMKYLITTYEIDLEVYNNDDWAPIHFIFASGNREMIKFICKYDQNLNIRTDSGKTPIDLLMAKYSSNETKFYEIVNSCYVLKKLKIKFQPDIINEMSHPIFHQALHNHEHVQP